MGREWCEVEGDPDVRVLPGQTYSLVVESPSGEAKIQTRPHGSTLVVMVSLVSPSAIKLADLHSIVTFALQDKAPDLKGFFKGDEQDLSFIDLYGGQGGLKCAQFHTVCPFAKFAGVQNGNESYDICVEQISYHVSLVSFLR